MSDVWETVSITLPRDKALLERFYNELMIPNFPVEGELEPIDVWIDKLGQKNNTTAGEQLHDKQAVSTAVSQQQTHRHHTQHQNRLCSLYVDLALDPTHTPAKIIGGCVWEYYKPSNVALITYLVIDDTTRGQGTGLYLCINAWQEMQEVAQLLNHKPNPEAILCEVNDPQKIGDSDDAHSPIERLRAFQQMGVRHIADIYYVQPALGGSTSRARDLLLGVVIGPMTLRDEETGKPYVHSSVIQQFITDFYTDLGVPQPLTADDDYNKCIASLQKYDKLVLKDFDLRRFKKTKKRRKQPAVAQQDNHIPVHVCVIGAGMAGLAAARELQQQGFQVTVIEARHRIGGRVYTGRSWDTRIDFGAAWLHGLDGNPLAEFAFDAIKNLTTTKSDEQSIVMSQPDGQPIPQEQMFETYMKFMSLQEQVQQYKEKMHGSNGICSHTLQESLEHYYQQTPSLHFKSPAEKQAMNYFLSFTESLQAASCKWLNAKDYDIGDEYEGGDHIPSTGFSNIAVALANGLKVETGVEVTKIEHTAATSSSSSSNSRSNLPTIRIHCASDKPTIHCNACIVTVPIGVLQAETITYSPSLPADRRACIQRMGAGLYNKCMLRFEHVFWPAADYIGYNHDLEHPEAAHKQANNLHSIHSERSNVWFVNYKNVTGQPILVAMLSGDLAVKCEQMKDAEVVELVLKRLRVMFADKVCKVVDHAVTRWGAEPFSRCSYSYLKAGSSIKDVELCGQPINNTLFFAGEHTSLNRFGYADGAYITGLREAKRIMELYKHLSTRNASSVDASGAAPTADTQSLIHSNTLPSKL